VVTYRRQRFLTSDVGRNALREAFGQVRRLRPFKVVDYIHANPVKHKLSARVRDWPWPSVHRYVRLGEYSIALGRQRPVVWR
jgi:REP element-mobilizing transposase RayT